MKDFLFSVKTSFVFVGTVIGAGFATGAEIKLYFSNYGFLTIVFSAFVFSLLLALFMSVAKVRKRRKYNTVSLSKIVRIVVLSISVCTMGGASEQLIRSAFGVFGGGIFTLVACFLLIKFFKKSLDVVNFIAVPLIVALLVAIFIRADTGIDISKGFGLFSGVGYACMNIYSAGETINNRGCATKRQIILSTLITFVVLSSLMMTIRAIIGNGVGDMPVVSVASGVGLKKVAEVVVYLAIFTTMLGNISVIYPDLKVFLKKDIYTFLVLFLVVGVGLLVGFTNLVQYGYPVISVFGLGYTVYAVSLFVLCRKSLFDKGNYGVHTSG